MGNTPPIDHTPRSAAHLFLLGIVEAIDRFDLDDLVGSVREVVSGFPVSDDHPNKLIDGLFKEYPKAPWNWDGINDTDDLACKFFIAYCHDMLAAAFDGLIATREPGVLRAAEHIAWALQKAVMAWSEIESVMFLGQRCMGEGEGVAIAHAYVSQARKYRRDLIKAYSIAKVQFYCRSPKPAAGSETSSVQNKSPDARPSRVKRGRKPSDEILRVILSAIVESGRPTTLEKLCELTGLSPTSSLPHYVRYLVAEETAILKRTGDRKCPGYTPGRAHFIGL